MITWTLSNVRLFLGGQLLLASWIWRWLSPADSDIAGLASLAAAILIGAPLVWRSVRVLAGREAAGMNELVTVAILASLVQTAYGQAAVVAGLMQLSAMLDGRLSAGAEEALAEIASSLPDRVMRLLEDGTERETVAGTLLAGMHVRVRPGEIIPVDGVVLRGDGTVSEASVTGESLPMDKSVGDLVYAGSLNLTGVLDIDIQAVGDATVVARIRELIAEARATPTDLQRLIERHAGRYGIVTVMLAALIWIATEDLDRSISFLVMAYPDALIVAGPTAVVAALTCLARNGVMVRRVRQFETLARIRAVIWDKTGTLTSGELTVHALHPVGGCTPAHLTAWAAAAERASKHPVALAIVALAERARVQVIATDRAVEVAGLGVRAWSADGQLAVGRPSWLETEGVRWSKGESPPPSMAESRIVGVAVDGRLAGWIAAADTLRPEAASVVNVVHEMGLQQAIVSGDRKAVAAPLGKELGIGAVYADCLPGDKVLRVKTIREQSGASVFVGDGLNDAPALEAADVGIAMGLCGSDLASQCAALVLVQDRLAMVPFAIEMSVRCRKVTIQNLVFAGLWVAVGTALSALGVLSPAVAAATHLIDPFIILLNSGRLLRSEPRDLNEK